ncbi:oxidoreductase [Chitinophaga oryziterrae]|uniref:Oxidoreductase n=1 Tax=Chitinophaga oryziterrae TaxID=1031224 RepID=A0A6N8JEG7_9BACT|nr:Gfo/Idh/MocA family oxidoreductase [Chitinophaga oryziterrae]MVT43630.1 oxidoreductase [Chitinophaga oryziterrae]
MDKIIKAGICSYGMSGSIFHAPFIHVHPGFSFSAVVERSKHTAQERYPDVKVYASVEEMLQDASLDLIIVNTPNYTHYDYTKAALNAGKNVIVEKPFTVHNSEGQELIELAASKNLLLTVYHNRRYDGDFKIVKQVIQSGDLGEVLEAEIHYDRYREELSYKKHKEAALPGTGALYDLGSHLVDQALMLFGLPESVWADIRIIRKDSLVDDYFELVLFYANLRVRLKSNYIVREPLPSYQFHGRKGSFIKTKADMQETMLQQGLMPGAPGWGVEAIGEWGLLHTEKDGQVIKQYLPTPKGNYLDFYDDVYNALTKGTPNPVLPSDGLNVIKIIETAFESSKSGRVIPFKK